MRLTPADVERAGRPGESSNHGRAGIPAADHRKEARMKAETRRKPSNATWLDAANVEGECDHPLRQVEIAWYADGQVKVSFPKGTPAVIRQAYLTGADHDLILEVARR
jgi:hypothetical protein